MSESRYLPYGEERWVSGTSPTDFGFTSQRNEASFGLMDYQARYYSPALGRFVSPDTIVPEVGSSGGFNRYRYARNNPLKYIDPSGRAACVDEDCKHLIHPVTKKLIGNKEIVQSLFGNSEHIYNRPKVSTSDMESAFVLQTIGAGADAAGVVLSGIGATAEAGLTLAGAFDSEGAGALPGFLAGVLLYNKSGLNLADDILGGTSYAGSLASDTAAGNNYFVYDEKENAYVMVMGTGSQLSFGTAVAGLVSPEAFLDLTIDTVGLMNDTVSAFQLGDQAARKPVFEDLGLPTTPIANKLLTPRGIVLPQSLNGLWRSLAK